MNYDEARKYVLEYQMETGNPSYIAALDDSGYFPVLLDETIDIQHLPGSEAVHLTCKESKVEEEPSAKAATLMSRDIETIRKEGEALVAYIREVGARVVKATDDFHAAMTQAIATLDAGREKEKLRLFLPPQRIAHGRSWYSDNSCFVCGRWMARLPE